MVSEPSFLKGMPCDEWVKGAFGAVYKIESRNQFGNFEGLIQFYRSAFLFLLGDPSGLRWLFLVVYFRTCETVPKTFQKLYEGRCFAVLLGAVPPLEGFYEKVYAVTQKTREDWTLEDVQAWLTFYSEMQYKQPIRMGNSKKELTFEVAFCLEPRQKVFGNVPCVYFTIYADDVENSDRLVKEFCVVYSDEFCHEVVYEEIETDVVELDADDPRKNQFFEIKNTGAFYKELQAWVDLDKKPLY